jgi:hypothetical protein
VAFFAGAFLVAVAFFVEALGAAAGACLVLVTRPDLVLPRTRDTSFSTAGAGAADALGLPALALGFAAVFLVVVVAFLVTAAFFAAGFLVVVAFAFYSMSITEDRK